MLSCWSLFGRFSGPAEDKTETINIVDESANTAVVKPELYALVIGINEYSHTTIPRLTGAVPDADLVSDFLITKLGVPASHIKNLRNSEASRANVIQGFRDLQKNSSIRKGFPILIYFAGHGGLVDAPDEWIDRYRGSSKLQVIFPSDYNETCEEKKINCIPDKTIARLLNDLAGEKGDNITVIFDSCHSAGGNRAKPIGIGKKARSAPVELAIPVDVDNDILGAPTSTLNPRHTCPELCTDQSSHIYISACASTELAWEEDGKGAFTGELLRVIKEHGVDKVTYDGLIKMLPKLASQTPHCYGTNKSRILLNSCLSSRHTAYVPVIYDPGSKTMTLQAGSASKVTKDSVWEVRENAVDGGKGLLGRAKARVPDESTTELMPEEEEEFIQFQKKAEAGGSCGEAEKRLYARQIKCGSGNELKVRLCAEAAQLISFKRNTNTEEVASEQRDVRYITHNAEDTAEQVVNIAVRISRSAASAAERRPGQNIGTIPGSFNETAQRHEAVYQICNHPVLDEHGLAVLRKRTPACGENIEEILFAAARWNWYLQPNAISGTSSLPIEILKITSTVNVAGLNTADQWRAVEKYESLNVSDKGVVDIEANGTDKYAFRLKNPIGAPLYVRMFYFDTTTFAIKDMFGQAVANGRPEPTIPQCGEFIIGDGQKGGAPLRFYLEPDEPLEIGYLKVFWSENPLELDHIQQGSAFERGKPRKIGFASMHEWGCTILTLVQRSPANGGA